RAEKSRAAVGAAWRTADDACIDVSGARSGDDVADGLRGAWRDCVALDIGGGGARCPPAGRDAFGHRASFGGDEGPRHQIAVGDERIVGAGVLNTGFAGSNARQLASAFECREDLGTALAEDGADRGAHVAGTEKADAHGISGPAAPAGSPAPGLREEYGA